VIALDTNVLVSAHRRDHEFHQRASGTVRSVAEGASTWAIPWPCIHEFLAIVTHARIFDPPSTLDEALAQVDTWLESPTLVLVGERFDHWSHLRPLLFESRVVGGLVHDARVAAVCLAHGVTELWTADRDFGRFPLLRVRNPLVA
jgi:toxin-antitoxin system PIN domain toxin